MVWCPRKGSPSSIQIGQNLVLRSKVSELLLVCTIAMGFMCPGLKHFYIHWPALGHHCSMYNLIADSTAFTWSQPCTELECIWFCVTNIKQMWRHTQQKDIYAQINRIWKYFSRAFFKKSLGLIVSLLFCYKNIAWSLVLSKTCLTAKMHDGHTSTQVIIVDDMKSALVCHH